MNQVFDQLFLNKKLWMPDMVSDGLERGGNKAFALFKHADGTLQEVTYREIREESTLLSEKLKKAGLRKGDRLAVVAALRPWWYSLLHTALQDGYILVCIDPGIPDTQIQSMMRRTQVRAVFTTKEKLELPALFQGRIPAYSIGPEFPLMNGCRKVDALLGAAEPLPKETFFVLFSSGTTGETRKAVLLPHTTVTRGIEYGTSYDAGVYKNVPAYSLHERDLMLFPPYHIAGLLCAVYDIYCNTQVIMLERLLPSLLTDTLKELQPDNICTVPSMLNIFMKKIRVELSGKKMTEKSVRMMMSLGGSLRRDFGSMAGARLLKRINREAFGGKLDSFMIGGSPCDAETMKFYLDMGIKVSIAYGLTELGAPLAVTGPGYYPGTTGRVLRHTSEIDIRIVNPDEKGHGSVEVLSPYRMIGYLEPEQNEGCFTEDGYFKTGDIGYFDENECLVICGREKETIVFKNGEKLLPEEIEAHYQGLRNVGELVAFRVPDGTCDTFSIAVTKSPQNRGLPEDAVRSHVEDRAAKLSGNLVPKDIYVLPSLPMSSSHKVQRFRLTEMAEKGLELPISEACMKRVEEDDVTGELRGLLVEVGGNHWKNMELTEGLSLGLDSLQTMELLLKVQEHFGLDMFALAKTPDTFGELLEAVNHFDLAEKNNKRQLDLSQFPLPVKESERILYTGVKRLVRTIYRVHSTGVEHIPEDDNVLICSNHLTALDPGWILSQIPEQICRRTAVIGKREAFEDKALTNFVRSQHIIPVDRTGNSIATLDRCRELLQEGWNIMVFPEGSNYENGTRLRSLREGPARLSIATGKPIIPVRIKGVVPQDSNDSKFLPPVGKRIDVVFGEPIYPGNMTPVELNAILTEKIDSL